MFKQSKKCLNQFTLSIKWKALLLAIILLPSISFAEAKAYEVVHYMGKTQNITINLAYADGYISASEITTMDIKTKKRSTFLLDSKFDNVNKLKFYHRATGSKLFSDYFILEGIDEDSETLPNQIRGKYYFNGSAYGFVLIKDKM